MLKRISNSDLKYQTGRRARQLRRTIHSCIGEFMKRFSVGRVFLSGSAAVAAMAALIALGGARGERRVQMHALEPDQAQPQSQAAPKPPADGQEPAPSQNSPQAPAQTPAPAAAQTPSATTTAKPVVTKEGVRIEKTWIAM